MSPREWDRLRDLARRVRAQVSPRGEPAPPPQYSAPAAGPLRDLVLGTEPMVRRLLTENIIPFWQSRVIDPDHGGYRINFDSVGRWKGPAPKYLVVQARTLWFFSRLAQAGYGTGFLELADVGFDFLRSNLWDRQGGGFRWAVDHTGREPVDVSRRTYGQAFGLYAVSEYAAASVREEARGLASEVFELLEDRFHDDRHGGYLSAAREGIGQPDAQSGVKSQNDHLHLLEALATYTEFEQRPLVRERLWELLAILTGTVVRRNVSSSVEAFLQDWVPVVPPGRAPVSFGHDIEAVWLALAAADHLGVAAALFRDFGRGVLETLVRFGVDRKAGGVWYAGQVGQSAEDRRKVWWVQAEALVGCLDLYCRFGIEQAGRTYLSVLQWIASAQADWEHGEWHDTVLPGGQVTGDKAHPWKGPYHSGRSMLECLERLRALGAGHAPA